MPLCILIVDDEEAIRRLTARVLTASGATCAIAASSRDALELLAELRVDVALVDANLGAESGVELLSRVRREYPHVLRVLHTGDERQGPEPPDVELVLVKPVDFTNLVAELEAKLRTRTA